MPDGKIRVIEQHHTQHQALIALLIMSAHEIRYGRTPTYKISPPVSCTIEDINLPDWAKEFLTNFKYEP